ncbi:MAG: hypothetical protein E7C82_01640 [Anaerococcus hydrogenalis]|uniref:hypothetical protein n=1 Tax=Anaerococcus hydrogenalis TaxID=33029 RepID=UPI0029021097|nr:hypothetical protein [Anaerococcus hydrogenalis]MDU2582382.1 hypothetical protein [Anaerococcus hydrogenalis]
MKNKLIYLLFLSIFLTACSKKPTTRVIETSDNLENSNINSNTIDEKISEEVSFDLDDIEENKLSKEDIEQKYENDENILTSYGSYYSSLVDKSKANPKTGFINSVKFEDGYLIFSGVLNYNEEITGSIGEEVFDEGIYKFKLDPDVKMMAKSGMAKPMMMNEDEFIKYLNKCMGNGLGFVVDVDNSMAYEIIITS